MYYDLTDLRVFLAVAEELNLSRGAQRCHLAPSSVSLRIKGLEHAVGTQLMTRRSRGIELTPAGHVLKEHARRCIAQLEQLNADMLPFSRGLTGHVTLFANNNAISAHLPNDLARFFQAHPTVRMTLEERMSHDIVSAVASGRADVGVVALDTTHPDLAFVRYRQDELVLLVPLDNPLADEQRVEFSACFGQPFISLQPGAAIHTFLMGHASALGGRLDVRVQVSGYRAIARLVASGAGVGIVPHSALEPADKQELAVVRLSDPWAKRDLRVCYIRQPTDDTNPFRARLIETLCGQATDEG